MTQLGETITMLVPHQTYSILMSSFRNIFLKHPFSNALPIHKNINEEAQLKGWVIETNAIFDFCRFFMNRECHG